MSHASLYPLLLMYLIWFCYPPPNSGLMYFNFPELPVVLDAFISIDALYPTNLHISKMNATLKVTKQ